MSAACTTWLSVKGLLSLIYLTGHTQEACDQAGFCCQQKQTTAEVCPLHLSSHPLLGGDASAWMLEVARLCNILTTLHLPKCQQALADIYCHRTEGACQNLVRTRPDFAILGKTQIRRTSDPPNLWVTIYRFWKKCSCCKPFILNSYPSHKRL
jgi:hypothetical protein